jgi:hypothetical protein
MFIWAHFRLRRKPGFAGLRAHALRPQCYALWLNPSNPLRGSTPFGGEWIPGVEFCNAKLQKQIRNAFRRDLRPLAHEPPAPPRAGVNVIPARSLRLRKLQTGYKPSPGYRGYPAQGAWTYRCVRSGPTRSVGAGPTRSAVSGLAVLECRGWQFWSVGAGSSGVSGLAVLECRGRQFWGVGSGSSVVWGLAVLLCLVLLGSVVSSLDVLGCRCWQFWGVGAGSSGVSGLAVLE